MDAAEPSGFAVVAEDGYLDAASEALVLQVSHAALRRWLAAPGSDVEKALKHEMRARHAELCQETRRSIALGVLGVAVLRGRLSHLLEKYAFPGDGGDPELLLALYRVRDRFPPGSAAALRAVAEEPRLPPGIAVAPCFAEGEAPTAAARLAAEHSLPGWLAKRWVEELGDDRSFALGAAMCQPGRVTLRTNTLKATREEVLARIEAAGVRASPTAQSPWGVWLPDGRPPGGGVWQLPGFQDGLFEVQDEGSQLIALATEARPGDFVVDYCAGRGGKTWALAAMVSPGGQVLAWDLDAASRRQLAGERAELAAAAGLVRVAQAPPRAPCAADNAASGACVGVAADVVLVDAPCSSTGVLRRHPSQRWAVTEAAVRAVAAVQLQVLVEAAALVRAGGRLVYATCSLLREENSAVVASFQASELGAHFEPWPSPAWSEGHMRMLLPHEDHTDGFFMARWRRIS